jgi:alpha-glucosidase
MSEASVSGIPPMRPLAFEYPQDESFTDTAYEFMFGDDLLVAPVLTEGASTRSLKLPRGTWYDFWTGRKYQGGENVTVDAPLSRIPVFVKAGAVLPSRQIVQHVDESPVDPLTLTVYPSSSTSTSLFYEDDGRTFRYENGEFLRRTLQQSSTPGSISVSLSRAEGTYMPPRRMLVLRFIDVSPPPMAVSLGDAPLKHVTGQEFESGREGWTYDAASGQVWVRTTDRVTEQRFVLKK